MLAQFIRVLIERLREFVPTRSEHVAKAEGNASFALSLPLKDQPQIDWALVALFYAAMHYVEAFLAPTTHLKSHESRDKYISRDSHLRGIFKEYSHLKFFGYNARYEVYGFKAAQVTGEAVKDYDAVKAHIVKKL